VSDDALGRFAPTPNPETQPYWDGCRDGELRLPRCVDCDTVVFPPRPVCPTCLSRDHQWFTASGRARLDSYVISHRPAPGMEPPFIIALVRLEEGPRLMTNLVDCEPVPGAVPLEAELEVVFQGVDDVISVPLFRPVGGGDPGSDSGGADE